MNARLQKIAASDATILITGRTGTGKTHLAREIHAASQRRGSRFVAVNLATLSDNLIESELFGHERGAFSGADRARVGKLESANGGTVFLDEIGELPLRLQTKLLEALNSKVISPVGSNREIQLDVRIIVATNRDLALMVQAGAFREDLYFRVNTFPVHMPDLAAEPERIPRLAAAFLRAQGRPERPAPVPTPDFLARLAEYSWPGNVRELKNVVEFAAAMASGPEVGADCLPAHVQANPPAAPGGGAAAIPYPSEYRKAKESFERTYLEQLLRQCGGGVNRTARESGLSKVTVIEKIRRYGIDVPAIKYQTHVAQKARLTELT
jgi:DNA-binding NtrC family response regulator